MSKFARNVFLVVVAALPVAAAAAAAAFDFEDLPARTLVTTQYGPRGLLFPGGAFIDTDPNPRSGTRVLRSANPTAEFDSGPLAITFTSPQQRITFWASKVSKEASNGLLRAYDGRNTLVAQDGPKAVTYGGFTTFFDVKTPTAQISKIEFQIAGTEFEAIDDLTVEGSAPSLPASTPPVVSIGTPTDGAMMEPGDLVIAGTVTGENLFPSITVRLAAGLPPESTAPPSNNTVTLTGNGATRSYGLPYKLGAGRYEITVIASNSANQEGAAVVHLTSLPAAIRSRFASSGGASAFGTLRFAGSDGSCVAAVYDSGLISAEGTTTRIARGAIFAKWMASRESASPVSTLGCPVSEERLVGGVPVQDFRRGRIYVVSGSARYTPTPFVQAIDRLGGEAANGFPMADPTKSTGVMQTWLFQRFGRQGTTTEPTTMEIRGEPPVLHVARVGDDLTALTEAGLTLAPGTATVWRRFQCAAHLGPCYSHAETSPSPIENAGSQFCNGTRYPWTLNEWPAVTGNWTATPVTGWVKGSRLACGDNPITHEHWIDHKGCGIEHIHDHWFASDWNVHFRPFHSFHGLLADNLDDMEIEWEYYYGSYFFTGWGWPLRGDLLYTAGRHIVDCGHSPYNSEIHPPFIVNQMRMVQDGGRPATMAQIWVNGWFPGDAVEVDIPAPPRPNPTSTLTVTKPVDSSAAYGVNITFQTRNDGVRVRFSAPIRRAEVTAQGEMKWQTGRAYYGEWRVQWSP